MLKLTGDIFILKLIDEAGQEKPTHINAFQLIGMASSLDLSGFFEEEVRSAPFSFQELLCASTHPVKRMFCAVFLASKDIVAVII